MHLQLSLLHARQLLATTLATLCNFRLVSQLEGSDSRRNANVIMAFAVDQWPTSRPRIEVSLFRVLSRILLSTTFPRKSQQ